LTPGRCFCWKADVSVAVFHLALEASRALLGLVERALDRGHQQLHDLGVVVVVVVVSSF
jgi:hypothetical protein